MSSGRAGSGQYLMEESAGHNTGGPGHGNGQRRESDRDNDREHVMDTLNLGMKSFLFVEECFKIYFQNIWRSNVIQCYYFFVAILYFIKLFCSTCLRQYILLSLNLLTSCKYIHQSTPEYTRVREDGWGWLGLTLWYLP